MLNFFIFRQNKLLFVSQLFFNVASMKLLIYKKNKQEKESCVCWGPPKVNKVQ